MMLPDFEMSHGKVMTSGKSVAIWKVLGVTAVLFAVAPVSGSEFPFVLDQGTPVSLLSVQHLSDDTVLIALGELAFKNEQLLDLAAARSFGVHLTCDACHPDGGTSKVLFIEGLSTKPGTIDITHRAMTLYEDGTFNPVNVPSIFGARNTAPYGRSGKFATLREFTRFAVVEEFGGKEPGSLTLDALVAYETSLDFMGNAWLDDQGQLTRMAPESAWRGDEIFNRPFPNEPHLSCASCHIPETAFVDRRTHEVGTGAVIDTPTIRDLTVTPPYMHDGRFDSLAAVVDHFNKHFGLALTENEKMDLVAYLEAVGRGDVAEPLEQGGFQLETILILLERTLLAEDWALGKMVINQVLIELNAIRGQSGAPMNEVIDRCIYDLGQIDGFNKIENYDASLAILYRLRAALVK